MLRATLKILAAAPALATLACAASQPEQPTSAGPTQKAAATTTALPRLIPVRDFFRNPDKTDFKISPDGAHVAFLAPWKTRLNIHVQKLGVEGAPVSRITEATERDIIGYAWANNGRIAFIQDTGGDENYRAYAVNIDGSNAKDLTPFKEVKTQLVDKLEDDPEHMLISLNKRDKRIFDVYRINIDTGEMSMIAENPGNITSWTTDNDGKLRLAATTDGVQSSVLYRKTEDEPFKTIATTNFKNTLSAVQFTFDNKKLYVLSDIDRDKIALFEYDPDTASLGKLLYAHDEVDIKNVLRSKKRKVITGVTYVTQKRQHHFFDELRRQLQETLEARLPGFEVAVASMSKDERKVLVRTYSDKTRGAYYFYDRDARALHKLADVSPWLNPNEMADMKPIVYTARDGLTINGYLTLPRGVEPKGLPVVINPHGGPWHRDQWGFNPEVQLLANRGYAVLQMNFRGSIGYGKAFWMASFKQWGKAMQDDISDGVRWLIDQGIADPKRIGIYGGSYGGYATLAGLTFTPELYACGVDYVGVSNLFTFVGSFPPYWQPFREMFYEMVGHPEKDKELFTAASPFFHVDRIVAPLFVAQGANDPRVKKAESDQIVAALKKRGIDAPYMVKDNEGHGFKNEENRFEFYGAMQDFLAKHLGGRSEPASN